MRIIRTILAGVLAAALLAAPGFAAVVIGTDQGLVRPGMDNQGWWQENLPNTNPTNDNYITGSGDTYRSYFTFDLSGVSDDITALSIQLRRYEQSGSPVLTFWDVATSAVDLAQRNVVNSAIFDDLGTGTQYGMFMPGAGDSFDVLSFDLNAAAVADANAARGGYFSVGARVGGGIMFSTSGSEPGNGGPGYTQQITLETTEVPLPAGILSLAGGLGGLLLMRRRA